MNLRTWVLVVVSTLLALVGVLSTEQEYDDSSVCPSVPNILQLQLKYGTDATLDAQGTRQLYHELLKKEIQDRWSGVLSPQCCNIARLRIRGYARERHGGWFGRVMDRVLRLRDAWVYGIAWLPQVVARDVGMIESPDEANQGLPGTTATAVVLKTMHSCLTMSAYGCPSYEWLKVVANKTDDDISRGCMRTSKLFDHLAANVSPL